MGTHKYEDNGVWVKQYYMPFWLTMEFLQTRLANCQLDLWDTCNGFDRIHVVLSVQFQK